MTEPSDIVAISLTYDAQLGDGRRLSGALFEVLGAVRREGSIAAAARVLQWSYRHLWGFLKDQELLLGRGLMHWDKGRSARLTDFAQKLLWAETRIRARLAPQIENLQTEIGRELTIAFNDAVPILRCAASHDQALPELQRLCATAQLLLDLRYEGSLQALDSLRHGRCQFAVIHLPLSRPELACRGSRIHRAFGPLLRPGREKLIRVSQRTQGLIVAAGNPLALHDVQDLTRARFVNRPPGTGTRALLDELLAAACVPAQSIRGYEHSEATHLSVAAAVADGTADAGFGDAAASSAHDLGFIALVREDCFLVCQAVDVDDAPTLRLREVLASPAWCEALRGLHGYGAEAAGEVVSLRRTLPWYR